MLMVMPSRLSTPINASLVNWEPWSLLNTSGLPCRRKASSRQSTQNTASMLLLMRELSLIKQPRFLASVQRGACNASQNALAAYGNIARLVNPVLAHHGRLIPDFFLSQSSSILRRPISPYRCSGSLCAATGWGPRRPSNSVQACSWIAFFHWLSCTGWTPQTLGRSR